MHGGLYFRIGHQRQIDQALDRAPTEGLPDSLVFGLDLLGGWVCRQVNAEPAQAGERTVDGLRVFALQYMLIDLQAGGVRDLDVGSPAPKQLPNELVSPFEVTAQKLALRTF